MTIADFGEAAQGVRTPATMFELRAWLQMQLLWDATR
eukprot:COSAG04_NODE_29929_length_265_cov_1.554217_1_plen_36_part_10